MGATDDLKDIGGGSLLLQRLALLIEQPSILDGDHGLRGKVLNKFDLLVGEWEDFLAIDRNNSDELLFF